LKNDTDQYLFVMDGEELIGARQDRVAVASALVDSYKEVEFPVVCIEKGRWSGEGDFTTGYSAFPGLRYTLTFSRKEDFKVNQETVWSQVETKLTTLRVKSNTFSMHHSFQEREEDVKEYTMWEPSDETVGVMAFTNRGFLCCDILGSSHLFKCLKNKILAGYALDAIEDRIRGRSFNIDVNRAYKVWKAINRAKVVKKRNSVDIGSEEIMDGGIVKGKVLKKDGNIVHATYFPAK